ncbi:MAG: hypothetical protein LBR36_02575, partial [Bacteroidales bacterium]|nr:hypothetical protein [Bacteroidales bacterium]
GFKVGDIYYKPNGEPEGVVWWIADTTITIDTFYYGQHGKILSIDEQPSIMWGGPSYYIIYALDTVDGKYNTDLIMLWLDTVTTQLSPSNLETVVKPLFQAAPWCVAHGEGWYLPAIRELFLCFFNRPYLNAVLQTIPNATLINLTSFVPGEYHYWSSTLIQPFETSNKALTVFTNHLTVEAHQNSCVQLNGYANTRAMKRF